MGNPGPQSGRDPGHVQEAMRRISAIAASILITAAAAQTGLQYREASGSLLMRWTEFSLTQMPGGVFRFDLTGNVYVASKTQGIEVWAPRVRADAISKKGKQADAIRRATATGGVRIVRTAASGSA